MPTKKVTVAALLTLAFPIAGNAQSMLGLEPSKASPAGALSSVPGGSLLSGIPGIGGLFGGGDGAKESTQIAHMTLHEAGNAARLAELVSHTESWLVQLMRMEGGIAGGDIAQFGWMLAELGRVRESMQEIVYDPAGYGSYDQYNEFVRMQQARSAERLENVAIGLQNLEGRADVIGSRTAELMAANEAAEGGIQVQQIGNEATGLNIEMQRQQLVLMSDLLRAQTEQEARQLENQLLANERWCAITPELESCGGGL